MNHNEVEEVPADTAVVGGLLRVETLLLLPLLPRRLGKVLADLMQCLSNRSYGLWFVLMQKEQVLATVHVHDELKWAPSP